MKEKVYLITGGCGFIGSHIIDVLLDTLTNIKIINVDKLGIGSDINNVRKDDRVINQYIDICDEKIYNIFEEYNPDYIIHCAAESHVDRSISNPLVFVDSNVKGTANILECMRRYTPNARMVHVSTDEVYGHLHEQDPPFTELSQLDPRSPYSASKAGSDMLAFSYRNTYNLNITVTRCCNNYGPRQHNEKLIPTVINSIENNKKIPVYGNGLNIREWIYVVDHAEAIVEILHDHNRKLYNIYGVKTVTNIDIITNIIEIYSKINPDHKQLPIEEYIEYVEDRKGHDFKYAMSTSYSSEVKSLLGQNNFTDGLLTTLLYYT